MADDSSQGPSAARLQGPGEIAHHDLGLRGRLWRLAATLARRCRTATLRLVLALLVSAVSLAGGIHEAAAAALTVEGGEITDVPPGPTGVRSFRGIPFAAPPVGELRWSPPQSVKPWFGERSAEQFGPRCMQTGQLGDIDPANQLMSEDCLYPERLDPCEVSR